MRARVRRRDARAQKYRTAESTGPVRGDERHSTLRRVRRSWVVESARCLRSNSSWAKSARRLMNGTNKAASEHRRQPRSLRVHGCAARLVRALALSEGVGEHVYSSEVSPEVHYSGGQAQTGRSSHRRSAPAMRSTRFDLSTCAAAIIVPTARASFVVSERPGLSLEADPTP